MIRTDRRMRLCTAMILGILAFIWGNSLMSAEASHTFSQWVKALLKPFLSEGSEVTRDDSDLLRKMAHFAEFAALGFCLAWRGGMSGKKPYGSFLSGAAAGAVDETIQLFVPLRGPRVTDVLIDSGGVLTGMILCYMGHTLLKKRNNKSILEDKT